MTNEERDVFLKLLQAVDDLEDNTAGEDDEVFWLAGNIMLEDLNPARILVGLPPIVRRAE